eukprot:TRINITY_DN5093_c0_g1_i1.p2 TRINITY_DN5093_c0_g1~~TRINITY_DN5093_c0_g1_i1.p2  ORF type:complete len:184 (+),score=26.02 TRINITY_DN5093_c0_g1_i1:204-755(+)
MASAESSTSLSATEPVLNLRRPTQEDGVLLWRLVEECAPLERNTCYAYVLMASDFADSCVLAELDGRPAGFLIAYHPPRRPEVLFVWQIGVLPTARGHGVGRAMLDFATGRGAWSDRTADRTPVEFLEATIAPDNPTSEHLFRSFARAHCVPLHADAAAGFTAEALGGGGHPPEPRYRIGPLP